MAKHSLQFLNLQEVLKLHKFLCDFSLRNENIPPSEKQQISCELFTVDVFYVF